MRKPILNAQSWAKKPMNSWKRIPITMKLLAALAISPVGMLAATDSYAQTCEINISSNWMTIGEVLEQIKHQTDFEFFYNNAHVDLNRKVNVSKAEKDLFSLLDSAFEGTNVNYKVVDKSIILTTKNTTVSNAQDDKIEVKGRVLDVNGSPIIGATIFEKGTTNGTVTDMDGNFVVSVGKKSVLEISYIGFITQKVHPISGKQLIVTLKEDTELLDEVVVVGYGSQSKVNLTGSVATVSTKELEARPLTSVTAGIQGMVPGVTITSGSGRPGQDGGSIRVRGQGTLNNSNPFILVDGIEVETMDDIDPNDIASISVLKDAASAAIYGSKASNGVILITTKRGESGRPVLSYNTSFGWQKATGFVERMNSYDAARCYNLALKNSGKAPRFTEEELQKFKDGSDPYRYPNTDWNDLGYQGSGFMHKHNVSVNGGTDAVKYMVSLGYLGQEGIMEHSDRHQFNMRTNVDVKLSDYFGLRTSMSYINNAYSDPTNSYVGNGSDQIIRQLNRIAPWIVYKDEEGNYGTIGDGNPIAWLDLGQTVDTKNQNTNSIVAVDFTPIKDLKLTAQGSYTSNVNERSEFIKDIQYNPSKYDGPNNLNERTIIWNRYAFDGLANYSKSFKKHNIKAMLGYHLEKYSIKISEASRKEFPSNEMTDMDAGKQSTWTNGGHTRDLAMMSYFGRVNYDYAGKYLFEANFRADASSRFSPDNRWGYFPSFSVGWRISEENFMEGTRHWLQSMKLRGSWGQLGNQDALNDFYPWLVTYSIGKNYPFDGVVNTGITPTNHKLSTISWEKSTTWGVGLDFSILNAIDVTFDYYNRKTSGIIMDVPVPGSFGLGAYKDNVGKMRNSGFELSVGYHKSVNDWNFKVNGNIAYNKNEILDLGGVNELRDEYYINQIGHAYKSFYVYKADGLFQSQEEADAFTEKYGNPFGRKFKAGDIKYVDTNNDGKLTSADRVVEDAELPKFTYGLNLSASWKNVDLSMFMQGAFGVARYFNHEVYGIFSGDSSHPSTAWLDAWSPENPGGKFPYIAEDQSSPSMPSNYSTFWMCKTNYLRFKNIQLGYTFPSSWIKKLGLTKARVYYSGENLFKIDNLPVNIDPEASSGRGSHYPQTSTHSLGLSLTF